MYPGIDERLSVDGPKGMGFWTVSSDGGASGHLRSVFEHPPSISAPAHRRTKRKTAFESSRKIISKSFRSFFGSGQNWGHQGSKFQKNQNGFWTIKSLILKVEQRFWYHRVCLAKARRTMYNLTLKGQGHNLTSGQVRARSLGDPNRSSYTSFDAPCGYKRNESNPTSLSYLVLKLLAKNCWRPRVTSMAFRGVTD